jgi:hypothetical protein
VGGDDRRVVVEAGRKERGHMTEHWFWWLMTAAVVVWYSTITIYVTWKGIADIKNMLRDLTEDHAKKQVNK